MPDGQIEAVPTSEGSSKWQPQTKPRLNFGFSTINSIGPCARLFWTLETIVDVRFRPKVDIRASGRPPRLGSD